MLENPYKTLSINKDADEKTIKQAYRRLAKQHHPDVGNEKTTTTDRFQEIQEAYEILTNKDKKAEWEQSQTAQKMLREFVRVGFFDDSELVGEEVRTSVTLTLQEALKGREVKISFADMIRCTTCQGSGADPTAGVQACPYCGGTGRSPEIGLLIDSFIACPNCAGSGKAPVRACPTCSGQRHTMGRRSVRVRIPAFAHEGQVLRVKGKGREGLRTNGDLLLTIKIETPQGFQQRGDDLLVEKNVSVTEAVLGGTLEIKEPLGETLHIRIPPSSSSGKLVRVRGHGLPIKGKKRGHLYVRLRILVPDDLSHKERKLYLELATLEEEKFNEDEDETQK